MMKVLNFLLSGKFLHSKGNTKRSREQTPWGNLTENISTTFFFISNWLRIQCLWEKKILKNCDKSWIKKTFENFMYIMCWRTDRCVGYALAAVSVVSWPNVWAMRGWHLCQHVGQCVDGIGFRTLPGELNVCNIAFCCCFPSCYKAFELKWVWRWLKRNGNAIVIRLTVIQ